MTEAVRAPKTTQHLEQIRRMVAGEAPPPPVAELIGFRLIEADLGQAVVELDASARYANPMGTLHGGVLCDIADAAIGCALASTVEDDESFTSLDLTVKFFKPIWNARIKATARLARRTRTLAFLGWPPSSTHVGVAVSTARRPPPRRVRQPRASSRAGHGDVVRYHGAARRWPSTSEHGAEPDAWGRQEERRPLRPSTARWGHHLLVVALLRYQAGTYVNRSTSSPIRSLVMRRSGGLCPAK